ncbi:uncharacterized protein TRUGW13939_02504 [Talaromyces rugulosus]|uniref:Cytochrome P450 n=1 Tax=Talaromyces rugulosus TaxID=121627 RepID=A0A7H8QPL0_TALRU|nr:uncharacterized protein TRUGW13939_02504 [Talaromyces rugulosus]QKX55411.1 hypothetical protein TRUGW13939_02504 [Talaromyces rugulosus]
MSANIVIWSVLGLVFLRVLYERIRDRSLPPGPPRLPLIGNLHQAPTDAPWLTYQKWIKQYGPIVSAQFGGNTVIFIGDATIARELLEKRGHIYSDRPRLVMAGENLTKGMHLLLRRYDERYKLHQRLDAPVLSPRASKTYYPMQDLESKQLLFDFLSTNNFQKVYERYAGSLVYSLAYGIRLHTGNEPMLHHAHQVQENFGYAGRVGTWIVDALPFLNHLPPSLAPWKKTAEKFYQIEKALHLGNMQTGLASKGWNWTKEFSKSKQSDPMSEIELAYNLGILADAGFDTTSVQMQATVLGIFWAMALDENKFDRPLEFLPERWLEKSDDGKDQFVNFFGHGRRICTGRHIAKNSLFLLIARILWGFNIRHAVDQDGKIKEVDDLAMTSGFVSSPLPFEAVFEPRSAHSKEVIGNSWHSTEKDVDVLMDSIKAQQISAGLNVLA